jgi:hypothetical protein
MQTEEQELIAEFKKLNLDLVNKQEVDGQNKDWLSVEVEIDCDINIQFMKDYVLTKRVHRGNVYYVVFDHEETTKLKMRIGVELPLDFQKCYPQDSKSGTPPIATTFPDLCWQHAEGTTPQTMNEISTKMRDGAIPGDLTWVLPSKFVDDFVEMMHTLNQGILSGLMQDSFIYGPYIYRK